MGVVYTTGWSSDYGRAQGSRSLRVEDAIPVVVLSCDPSGLPQRSTDGLDHLTSRCDKGFERGGRFLRRIAGRKANNFWDFNTSCVTGVLVDATVESD